MSSRRRPLAERLFLALALVLSSALDAAAAEWEEMAPGCIRTGHKVTCRAWSKPDAPDLPYSSPFRDFLVLDLSSLDAARKLQMISRSGSCNKQVLQRPAQGLGAALPDGRLPARWLGARYDTLMVLGLRGAGLRGVHRDAFQMLDNMQQIFLGSNMLQALDPDMWRNNPRLVGVLLDHNMALQIPTDGPLFRSDSIEMLDLTACGLRTVPAKAFQEMPALQVLRLERNCLRSVPAPALALLPDLWSLWAGENAITSLSAGEAQLLARLPDTLLHGNPWICDCALRDTMLALQGEARDFWEQSKMDLVCMWPHEDIERPWADVLVKDHCREFNESLENYTSHVHPGLNLPAPPAWLLTQSNSSAPHATATAAAAAATGAAQCGADGGAFCRWTVVGVLLLLVLGIAVFAFAAFTERVAVSISVDGRWRKRKDIGASQVHLARNSSSNYGPDELEELTLRDAHDQRTTIQFGRRS